MVSVIPILILAFYGISFIACIGLIISAINNRLKERKREKEEFKDYDRY